jgi:uroporphyrin-III C-methyltransferase/precorrin-2 dehydrogenase/sirohydrochlorin ferrochelatase/uroporphyrin-III C-methyltransferase
VDNLVKNNISDDKLLAVIEQATTPLQNIHVTNLYKYQEQWRGRKFISPSLVIIGKVVALHEQFKWIENSNSAEHYFKPLAKLITTKPDSENPEKVNKHVSRA